MKMTFTLMAAGLTALYILLSLTNARPRPSVQNEHLYSIAATNRAQRRAAGKAALRGY